VKQQVINVSPLPLRNDSVLSSISTLATEFTSDNLSYDKFINKYLPRIKNGNSLLYNIRLNKKVIGIILINIFKWKQICEQLYFSAIDPLSNISKVNSLKNIFSNYDKVYPASLTEIAYVYTKPIYRDKGYTSKAYPIINNIIHNNFVNTLIFMIIRKKQELLTENKNIISHISSKNNLLSKGDLIGYSFTEQKFHSIIQKKIPLDSTLGGSKMTRIANKHNLQFIGFTKTLSPVWVE